MPSVTMIDGMRPRVTSRPLTAPASAPTATPASRGRIRPPVLVATAPAATAHRPIMEPVDMSISPARITWLTARAMVPSTATEVRIDSRLEPLKNLSLLSEKTTSRPARNTRAGASGRAMNLRKASLRVPALPSAGVGARASLMVTLLSGAAGLRACPAPRRGGHDVLLRGLFPFELPGEASLSHNQYPVGHREYLFEFR